MPLIKTDENNSQFKRAVDYIVQTNKSVFLTGKAGTGKTTFLKYIKEFSAKNIAIVAPTGVAAINAGGVTMHSFFQLPLSPFIPEQSIASHTNTETTNKHSLLGRIRFNTEKRDLLQQLELLIIDEISMVRCDTLDAIDVILRSFRNRHSEPFGGVQILLIGDMFQLPPVVPDSEWNILSQVYANPYFFSSKAIQQLPYLYVELKKIYRQNDDVFISILNQVRNNELDEEGLAVLHSRYNPAFKIVSNDGYIILTTHNYKADAINASEMNKLTAPLFNSKAIIDGEFYERSYPADENLQLKIDAQVMFIKNDKDKRFFNGKIGTVTKIEDNIVFVQCKNEATAIELKKETWKNIRYNFNKQTQRIDEEEIGSFTQFPLRLAWAITIHKSQGLTFEKAIIDAGASFAPGQVYVALSRCTCLSGIVLLSKINRGLQSDERILEFINLIKNIFSDDELNAAKHQYQQKLLINLFSFKTVIKDLELMMKTVNEHESSLNKEVADWLQSIEKSMIEINTTLEKFQPQLQQLLEQEMLPEENEVLQRRLKGASDYFTSKLQMLTDNLYQSTVITDSKQHAIAYNEALKEFYNVLSQKINLFSSLKDGFNVSVYYQYKKQFQPKAFNINAYAGVTYKKTDSPHPELHKLLRQLRDKISNENDLPIYLVAGSKTLDEMASYLPQTTEELLLISGFGKAKTERFGKLFLDVINEYSIQYNLSSLIHEKEPKRIRKTKTGEEKNQIKTNKSDTKLLSYELYKSGKNVREIAAERNLALQTIEGHLAHFVEQGIIKIDELVSREKFILIEPAVRNYEGTSLTPIKEQLSNDVSYGEIRLVMSALAFEKSME